MSLHLTVPAYLYGYSQENLFKHQDFIFGDHSLYSHHLYFCKEKSVPGHYWSLKGYLVSSLPSPWMPPGIKLGNEGHLGDFIDGLGPAQIVGRQVLASPSMGDIQLALFDRKGMLEVEVVRAKGLLPKPGSKILPGMVNKSTAFFLFLNLVGFYGLYSFI